MNAIIDEDPTTINRLSKKMGMPPLIVAILFDRIDALTLLIQRGAVLDISCNTSSADPGWTPLHLAVSQGKFDMVKALLDGGAEPNVLTTKGKTPLDFATQRGDTALATLLRSRNAVPAPKRR